MFNLFKKKVYVYEAIDAFVDRMIINNKGISEVTKNTTVRRFRAIKSAIDKDMIVKDFNYIVVEQIIRQWQERGLNGSTIKSRMGEIKRMCHYWYMIGLVEKPIQFLKLPMTPRKKVVVYEEKDYLNIINALRHEMYEASWNFGQIYSQRGLLAEKVYISIRVLYETGLRPTEFNRLKWSDVDEFSNTITIRRFSDRKGDDRTIPVSGKLMTELMQYKGTLGRIHLSPWYKEHLSQEYIQQSFWVAFNKIMKKYNVQLPGNEYKIRRFRSTFATRAINKGVSSEFLARYLGHSNTTTIKYYASSKSILNNRKSDIRKLKAMQIFKK